MGRIVKVLISTNLAFVLAAILVISASAAKRRPTLVIVSDSPVVVAGRGFLRGERVALRTSINGQLYKKTVVANKVGSFTIRLAQVDAQCSPFAVSAVGARGSQAVATRKIRIPEPCGMVIQP